ncbi:Sulfide dehydrogenase (flavocytochrome c) flavoprotein chain precursor [Pelotomaculum sp. FP]|uniref:NAD(P)/FAD-dependent oxidoreductase n=1 Tax=Pelotomaculum sp. FP TaxID=261474 RepID=UPI001066A2F8|nr:FAD/NAD(P)-binding oxidoreductase [Pelotomaculum sp. FP]TEB15864.1 Sulfide dehydrogenase (flavocytochrome c) flavoprotein chain precursor [Pelotomaculum sp. FP]
MLQHQHCQILIIGGGTAGLIVASKLIKKLPAVSIVLLDSADKHYYQPAWLFAGSGIMAKEKSARSEKSLIPNGVLFLQEAAELCNPDENYVITSQGKRIFYDYLALAPGITVDWAGVKGLEGSIGKDGVVSIYSYEQLDQTWQSIKIFPGGAAVFTLPATPLKCPSAPQKIMYLAEEYFHKTGVRKDTNVIFFTAKDKLCEIKKYESTLKKVIERKNIKIFFKHDLEEVRPDKKEAVFKSLVTGSKETIKYDLLHVTPCFQAPVFLKKSRLTQKNGLVDVNPYTLQHQRYKNIFALGDAADLPTPKTGAAARRQAKVVAENLIRLLSSGQPGASYNGYTSCPITTGYGKVVLLEYDYDKKPLETFPFNQAKERYSMFLLDRYVLPYMYWNFMLPGRI